MQPLRNQKASIARHTVINKSLFPFIVYDMTDGWWHLRLMKCLFFLKTTHALVTVLIHATNAKATCKLVSPNVQKQG